MVDSIDFVGESGAECYQKFYTWDSNLAVRTKHRTNIVDKQLCYDSSAHRETYRLIVVYFKED